MADKRMMSKSVIDTDMFLDMPASTQCLYFHMLLRADDDGFLKNAKTIMRTVGASPDDVKLLIAKQYLIPFDTGIMAIKHWRIHNYIKKDRYKPTDCEEIKLLEVNEKGEYILAEPMRNQVGSNMEPQVRDRDRLEIEIGKDRDSRESSGKRRSANNSTTAAQKFKKPTLEELKAYIAENRYTFSAEAFMDYYESNGWKVGRNPMKSWQATCRTWQRHELPSGGQGSTGTVPPEIDNIPF
ncbi:hypothetical protein [Megasphaera sp.]|uniref:hypothetical protein n=1 Tax=Megasphaera sp. TaxID=2023260 RepID=UPI00399A3D91